MERNNSITNLFKLLLGGLVVYLVYKHFLKKKVDLDEIPLIGDLKKKLNIFD